MPSVAKLYDDGSSGLSGSAKAGLASGGGILCEFCNTSISVVESRPTTTTSTLGQIKANSDTATVPSPVSTNKTLPAKPPTVIVILNQFGNHTFKQCIKHSLLFNFKQLHCQSKVLCQFIA